MNADADLMRFAGLILRHAPDEGAGASPEFEESLGTMLRDADPRCSATLAAMTAIASHLLDQLSEESRREFWERLLPGEPIQEGR